MTAHEYDTLLANHAATIKHNLTCLETACAELRRAYEGRPVLPRHYEGRLPDDLLTATLSIYEDASGLIDRVRKGISDTDTLCLFLDSRLATIRLLINYVSETYIHEQPLNRMIGEMDGMCRALQLLRNDCKGMRQ